MSPDQLHAGTPVGSRMGSPPKNWWNAFGGPYPRFADSVSMLSPRSGCSGSSIQTVSPIRPFPGNSNWMSPYEKNRSPWRYSPVHTPKENFHQIRPPQRQQPLWNAPDHTFSRSPPVPYHMDRSLRPSNNHWHQCSPQPSGYRRYPSPKPKGRRGLNYNTKSVPRGSKGEVWRKSLDTSAVNTERQQPLERELNTTSQPDLLAPLATSTPIIVDSDVNVEDSDPSGEVNVVDPATAL